MIKQNVYICECQLKHNSIRNLSVFLFMGASLLSTFVNKNLWIKRLKSTCFDLIIFVNVINLESEKRCFTPTKIAPIKSIVGTLHEKFLQVKNL